MGVEKQAHIIGMGSYLPKQVLSNADLEKMVDTTDEWIVSRTGMKERRLAAADQFTSDLGVEAAKKAIKDAKVDPSTIEMVIVATTTPDYITPSTAALVQSKLGLKQAAAVDSLAACTGFIYALSLAKAYIESGMYKTVLVVAAEKMSAFIDYTDRNTCVLFGDGASAAVVSSEKKGYAIGNVCLGADGCLSDLIVVPGGGSRLPSSLETVREGNHTFKMQGKEVFKHAVRRMSQAAHECLEKSNLKEEDISWIIPHQANLRIMDAISKSMNQSPERVYKTVHKYGNTSASSIGIALDELNREEVIEKGSHLLLIAFGAGLTWGAALLTKN